MSNTNMNAAKKAKNDEFYTQLTDIEKELRHYTPHFRGKTVYCNCDDPRASQFFHYFSYNFEHFGVKRLIASCYRNMSRDLFSRHDVFSGACWLEYTGDKNGNLVPDADEIGVRYFKGDGDFRSEESIALLKQADIVVTNPPFSLFRDYVAQLIEYKKQFLIIGNMNAVKYKEIFPLIRDEKLWLGVMTGKRDFLMPDHADGGAGCWTDEKGRKWRSLGNTAWFTNLDHGRRHEPLVLLKKYNPANYPRYDNYDAIEVSKTADIPGDYDGVMGVPISYLDKHNPDEFEIVGATRTWDGKCDVILNGRMLYTRLLIRRRPDALQRSLAEVRELEVL